MRLKASSGWPSNSYRNFQQAFIAALAIEGCRVVDTRSNAQHAAFGAAVKKLQQLQATNVAGAKLFPMFHPTFVTGLYRDIDAALLLGEGMTVQKPPFFQTVEISISPGTAQRIMDEVWEVPQEQQEVLRQMARAFLEHMPQWATIA
jgi:hypothetical protein